MPSFRRGTDRALRRHQLSLHALFTVYTAARRDGCDKLGLSRDFPSPRLSRAGSVATAASPELPPDERRGERLMSLGEWMALLEHTGLLEMGQLSRHEARLLFKWSMLRAVSAVGAPMRTAPHPSCH